MKYSDQIQAMADEMGISLYQRFSEIDAASFLQVEVNTLATARQQQKISYFQIEEKKIEYFGHQLLEYLLGSVQNNTVPITNTQPDRIIRSQEVTKITGLSRTTLWRMEQTGDFPKRVSLGVGSVGWKLSEVEEWVCNLA